MTPAENLLTELRQQGFRLTPDPTSNGIVVEPASKLTDEIRSVIRAHKPELLRALAPALPPDLEHRIRAMGQRWNYSNGELNDALDRARFNQAAWTACVQLDEVREAEFRARGLLSRADA